MRRPLYDDEPLSEPVNTPERNVPLLSNFPLQQLLYYNLVYYFPYCIVNIALAVYKFRNSNDWRASFVSPIIVTLFTQVEPYRLYLGYQGNLKEQVPLLFAFLLLSSFACLLYLFYFLAMQNPLFPLDRILGGVQAFFCISELVFSVYTIVVLVRYKTKVFNVQKFTFKEDEDGVPDSAALEQVALVANSRSMR